MAETEPSVPKTFLDALSPGSVLAAKQDGLAAYLRVLHCDPELIDPADAWLDGLPQVVTIEILSPDAWPQITPLRDAFHRLATGLWAQHLDQDPFPFPYPNSGYLPKKISANYLRRQEELSRIVHAVADAKPTCFMKCERSRLFADSAHQNNCSQSLVRKWTRLFWQSGEEENSLFLRHRFSGASTIEEVLEKVESLPMRRGRPPTVLGLLPTPTNVGGEKDKALPSRRQRELFLKGFEEYINKNKNTGLVSSGKGFPWTDALQFVIERYFGTQTSAAFDRRGQLRHEAHRVPEHLLPTVAQFKPVIEQHSNLESAVKLIEGPRRFNLNNRAKGGAPRRMIIGPGSLYITDWTLADIHLVARLSRLPCGRPYVCTVKYPVAATPRDLWTWGCSYIGRPKRMPDDEIRRRLMSVSEATVREDGIWFLSVCFLSEDSLIRKLVFKATHYGNFQIRISFDLDDTNFIELLPSTDIESPIRVPIAAVSAKFANLSFQEVCIHVDDWDALDRVRLLEHKTLARMERERARRVESEAASAIAAKFGDVKGRNQVARLSDPKSERETELSVATKPLANNADMGQLLY